MKSKALTKVNNCFQFKCNAENGLCGQTEFNIHLTKHHNMKPIKLLFALLFMAGSISAQPGIWISGQLTNVPYQPYDVTLAVYSDPIVNATLAVDENGIIAETWVELPSAEWLAAEILYINCQSVMDTYVIPNDTIQTVSNVFVSFDVCYGEPLWGCTDPQASNYNPFASIDDGSCTYDECAFNELTLEFTGGEMLEDSASIYWLFFENNSIPLAEGPTYAFQPSATMCVPDGCYIIAFGEVPFGWDGGYTITMNGEVILSGVLAGGQGPHSAVVDSELLGCVPDEVPGCTDPAAYNFHPTATADDGSCQYIDTCFTNPVAMVIHTEMWGLEISWNLKLDGQSVASGAGYGNYSEYVHPLCLEDGCYVLEMFDSFGDGWNGATYTLINTETDEAIATGTLSSGSSGSVNIELNGDCSEDCGDIFFEFIPFGDPPLGCVMSAVATYNGNNISGNVEWDYGAGSPPDMWSGWNGGYQYSANGTYTVCVTYTVDNCVLQYCDEFVATDCGSDVTGCTDPLALNYNPNATTDDGSCIYPEPCAFNAVQFVLTTEFWASEISWSLLHNGEEIASSDGFYDNYMTYTEWLCLEDGCYTFVMYDSFGDGWNGGEYEFILDNVVLSAGTLEDGSFGYAEFDINTVNCEPIIAGCTDPEGDNYNPLATLDDGSCTYFNCNDNELVLTITGNTMNTDSSYFAWLFGINNTSPAEFGYYTEQGGTQTYNICAPNGCYMMIFSPVYEGFEGSYSIAMNGAVIASGDFDGSQSFWNFQVELGEDLDCPDYIFPGCTDPAALNYNPYANMDNGSCQYMFGCNIFFVVSPDTTGANTVWITPSPNIYNATDLLWDFGDGNTSTEMFPNHTYAGDGPYTLCLTVTLDDPDNNSSCTVTFCAELTNEMINPPGMGAGFSINVVDPGGITGAQQMDADMHLNLWPNPARNDATVALTLPHPDQLALELYDLSGKRVQQHSLAASAGENLYPLSLQALPAGMYLLRVSGNNYQQSIRVVKQ